MFKIITDIQFPRLLSQACRDSNSPFFGCFDRNWWHYRIRDFASVMLQQGGYTAFEYSKLPQYENYEAELRELAWGSAIFWNKRASRRGAFEEYYPWEQGYPPLAFSTLAIAKLVIEEVVDADDIFPGLQKAARQLERRFEYQAGNQQVAGLAALAALRKINPDFVTEDNYLALKEKTLKLQDSEGWYTEYDGPDTGYLSVTLDCLWDLFDLTNDRDYLHSAEKGLEYLFNFIARRNGGAGMHNARNTDYIVPYGICRFLESKDKTLSYQSSFLIDTIYKGIEEKQHFFHAIDDRYWSHYIGHSVVRAQQILVRMKPKPAAVKQPELEITSEFPNSGYRFKQLNRDDYRILISTKKGGIFSIYRGDVTLASDYGWIVDAGKKQMVNHWWSDSWTVNETEKTVEITGSLFPHAEKTSTPVLHFGLRVISAIFGSRVTQLLRNVLIFKSKASNYGFRRVIETDNEKVIVTDEITGRGVAYRTTRAPRASKRHVASADSWHHEDFYTVTESGCSEKIKLSTDIIIVETTFLLNDLGKQE